MRQGPTRCLFIDKIVYYKHVCKYVCMQMTHCMHVDSVSSVVVSLVSVEVWIVVT